MIFEKYKLDVDIDATRNAYKKLPLVSEGCTYQGCENFNAAINTLPAEVPAFFDSLGVDISRAIEVFGSYYNDLKYYDYGGFYHIAGQIISQEEELYHQINKKCWIQNENMLIKISDDFHVWFHNDCSLVPEDFPEPYFQMDISAKLPWALDRPYIDVCIPISKAGKLIECRLVCLIRE